MFNDNQYCVPASAHCLALLLAGWFVLLATSLPSAAQTSTNGSTAMPAPIVIAHRGASGYLPEHTEGAKVLAFAQGADYLEQDVVLSRDGVFIVSHDITMGETTDVAVVFPDRRRSDGKYYFADFTWSELQQLSVHERKSHRDDAQVFPDRFPGSAGQRIVRLEDEIRLIQGLNRTLGKQAGLYIELKGPQWHVQHFGDHMGARLLPLLARYGYRTAVDRCYLQCFEAAELQYLAQELKCQLPLIQLLANRPLGLPAQADSQGADPARGRSPRAAPHDALQAIKAELPLVAGYAAGIGPALDLLVTVESDGKLRSSGLSEAAHELGLQIHPYTVRADALPAWSRSVEHVHQVLLEQLRVDGFFTDFPDLGRQAVDASRE